MESSTKLIHSQQPLSSYGSVTSQNTEVLYTLDPSRICPPVSSRLELRHIMHGRFTFPATG